MIRGQVKHHPPIVEGTVVRLFEDYGFIQSKEGDEYYFNENNVVHPQFDHIKLGEHVRFIEWMGDEGMQAHRVSVHRRDEREAV